MATNIAHSYADQSRRFILQAQYELEKRGDRYQASEKASDALAQAVKAIATDRGWRHSSHQLRREIIDLLAAEFGRPELLTLQAVADQLHSNHYEEAFHDWQIAERLPVVTTLLSTMEAVREQGSNPQFVPSPVHQRTIERLRLSEEEEAAIPMVDWPPPMPPFDPNSE
jgi:hypothetical protein